jgi:hypothetical protein
LDHITSPSLRQDRPDRLLVTTGMGSTLIGTLKRIRVSNCFKICYASFRESICRKVMLLVQNSLVGTDFGCQTSAEQRQRSHVLRPLLCNGTGPFFQTSAAGGQRYGPKSRGLRGCWAISCSAFKGLGVPLLPINAHGFNGLRSKALLSRQRSRVRARRPRHHSKALSMMGDPPKTVVAGLIWVQ